jgi:hypoxia-inducible factor 1 alpha
MIGQSIYDFSHPCDHEELRDALSLRTDGGLMRSFFLRLKSSLTVKGRSHNMKAASFKVSRFLCISYICIFAKLL